MHSYTTFQTGSWYNKKFTGQTGKDEFSNTAPITGQDGTNLRLDDRFTNSLTEGTAALLIRKTIMTKNNFEVSGDGQAQEQPSSDTTDDGL